MAESTPKISGRITRKTCLTHSIDWRIPDFFLNSEKLINSVRSPSFSFLGKKWALRIFPNSMVDGAEERVVVSLICEVIPASSIHVSGQMGIKKEDGSEWLSVAGEFKFGSQKSDWARELCRLTTLYRHKNENALQNAVTVFCVMSMKNAEDAVETYQTSTFESPARKLRTGPRFFSGWRCSHDRYSYAKAIKREDFQQIEAGTEQEIKVNSTNNHAGVEELIKDFRDLLINGEASDVTLKVKNREFRVHSAVLVARSSVFAAMMRHDMRERRSRIVEIQDCEPDAFQQFLNYIYSGDIGHMLMDTVCPLFVIADKYDAKALKTSCIQFMMDNLSVEMFCDVLSLSLKYNECELLEKSSEYFAKNMKKILHSDKWVSFMMENPMEANELHIKAVDYCAISK